MYTRLLRVEFAFSKVGFRLSHYGVDRMEYDTILPLYILNELR